jgi:hypothetical protein
LSKVSSQELDLMVIFLRLDWKIREIGLKMVLGLDRILIGLDFDISKVCRSFDRIGFGWWFSGQVRCVDNTKIANL